jgi:hypothetical protein
MILRDIIHAASFRDIHDAASKLQCGRLSMQALSA